jgi:hypothetical protein
LKDRSHIPNEVDTIGLRTRWHDREGKCQQNGLSNFSHDFHSRHLNRICLETLKKHVSINSRATRVARELHPMPPLTKVANRST